MAWLFLMSLLIAVPVLAQDETPQNGGQDASAQTGDAPGRVARLSYIQNAVSFEPSGETDWSEASLNYPLTTGDRLWADKDARAEVETGNIAVQMSQNTDLTATSLTDELVQFGLAEGTIRVRTFDMRSNGQLEVDTPNAALVVTGPSNFRVETYPDQNMTMLFVNSGEVQVSGSDLNQTVAERTGGAVDGNESGADGHGGAARAR